MFRRCARKAGPRVFQVADSAPIHESPEVIKRLAALGHAVKGEAGSLAYQVGDPVLPLVLDTATTKRWFGGSPVATALATIGFAGCFVTYGYNIAKPVCDAYCADPEEKEDGEDDS